MEINTQEVTLVKTQASKALTAASSLLIVDEEGLKNASDLLGKMKTVAKLIKERREAITRPMMEALNSARDLFKQPESNLAEAERMVKAKMLEYQRDIDEKAEADRLKLAQRVERGTMRPETAVAKMEAIPEAPKAVQGKSSAIAFRTVKKYRVTDETKLPREYLVPDMGKITEAIKAGKEVPGAEMYEEKVVASSTKLDSESPLLGQR